MKSGWLLASALSAMLLGGCATSTNEKSLQNAATGADAIPKVSVAADRCLESFRLRSPTQGAFARALMC